MHSTLPDLQRVVKTACLKAGVSTLFTDNEIGSTLSSLIESKNERERQSGSLFAQAEYENLHSAVRSALHYRIDFFDSYEALFRFLKSRSAYEQATTLCRLVLDAKDRYISAQQAGEIGAKLYLVYERLAYCHLKAHRNVEAGTAYQDALKQIAALTAMSPEQRQRWSVNVYHQLGIVAQEQRQWAQAEQTYRQALDIYIEFNDRYYQANVYHQLGMVAQGQRQWAQAEQYYRQALDIYIEFNDRYNQASTYHQLGMVAQAQRQWAQAEYYFRHSLDLKIEFNDRCEQAPTYHNLGAVAQALRQWAQAEHNYRQALDIKIEFNDRYEQASTYHQLGMLAQEQRQWAQAEHYYHQAVDIYLEFNDCYSQAPTYGQLALLEQERENWSQSASYSVEALRIFAEFGDQHYIGVTLRNLAHLHRASGDASVLAATAQVLGVTVEQVAALFAEAGE